MGYRIDLNGDWLFKDYYGQDWVWRDAHKPGTRDVRHWRKGDVPGSVQNDLWQCGEIANPYFERNSLLIEWVPERTWLYKKAFWIEEQARGQRVQLVFNGVDYEAQFFLNGDLLGAHRGMYTPIAFDVSEQLKYDAENLLAVAIEPAPQEQPQVGRSSLVRTHKSRMTYWWDFCPRMIHLGIWDKVWLDVTGSTWIENILMRPRLTDDFQHADISITLELSAEQDEQVQIEIVIDPPTSNVKHQTSNLQSPISSLQSLASRPQSPRFAKQNNSNLHSSLFNRFLTRGHNSILLSLPLEQPHLWQPNGGGEPALYRALVRVWQREADSDSREVTFGIRRIELVANEQAEASARPYTFVVNGRKVYINGWNWVPLDVMYGVERPETLEHLLELARRAHVNMLRVWGGGLIEKEAFYDACDRKGIMVWQEFIQSSSGIDNEPPSDPKFIEWMTHEAEQIIPRKRNHPSLAAWCGGNELQFGSEQPADDTASLLGALHELVTRLDPDRLWFPTSPTGRVFSNSLENIARDPLALHDVHGPWEFQGLTDQYTLYNSTTSLFHSEFGTEGFTNRRTLDTVIAPEHQQPVTLDNPFWFHLGAWWVKAKTWRAAFGELPDVDTHIRATQHLQAEGVRYAIESNRRRMYQNSGSLPWQFNEPYPMAACTSAVDYYGNPKPLYYAVARAYAPLSVTAKFPTLAWAGREQFEAEVWAANSHLREFQATCTMRLGDTTGRVYDTQTTAATIGANRATRLDSFQFSLDELTHDIFLFDLLLQDSRGETLARNRYLFSRTENLAPLLDVPTTRVKVRTERAEDTWTLTLENVGDYTALFVWLDDTRAIGGAGHVYFDDNYFCLLPGETRTITAEWQDVLPADQRISVQGWNTIM